MSSYAHKAVFAGLAFALALGGSQSPARADVAPSAPVPLSEAAASASAAPEAAAPAVPTTTVAPSTGAAPSTDVAAPEAPSDASAQSSDPTAASTPTATATPSVDSAEDLASANAQPTDKADFYDEDPALTPEPDATDPDGAEKLEPMTLSEEMKYFARWESSGNYDQGFSSGDGFNAMGYYQFDRRYGLVDFMRACLAYDPETFAMFEPVVARGDELADPKTEIAQRNYDVDLGGYVTGFTSEIGMMTENAWHAAYKANPTEFSALQDAWAYQQYYEPVAKELKSAHGIDIAGRSDGVKSLFWGATNLFGTGGVEWFIENSGITGDMSDADLVRAFCDYVIDNVSVRYPDQSKYWRGWQTRYKDERAHYLTSLRVADDPTQKTYSDVDSAMWYADGVRLVTDKGIMGGYGGTTLFGVGDSMTRGQLAVTLYNYMTANGTREYYSSQTNTSGLPDVQPRQYWTAAANWAVANHVINGVGNPDGSLTFDADSPVTFEQLIAILGNLKGAGETDRAVMDKFVDAFKVSPWAEKAMAWAANEGLVNGSVEEDGLYLHPTSDVPRERVAAVIKNAFDKGMLQ